MLRFVAVAPASNGSPVPTAHTPRPFVALGLFVLLLARPGVAVAQNNTGRDSVLVQLNIYHEFWVDENGYNNCSTGLYGIWPDVLDQGGSEAGYRRYTLVDADGNTSPTSRWYWVRLTNPHPRVPLSEPKGTYGFLSTFVSGAQGLGNISNSCATHLSRTKAYQATIEPLYARYEIEDGTPVAEFTWEQAEGLDVAFDGSSSHEFLTSGSIDVAAYEWTIEGTTRSEASFTHTFTEPDTFDVTLKVTDDDGEERSLTQEVIVRGVVLTYEEEIVQREVGVGESFTVIGRITNVGTVEAATVRVVPVFGFLPDFIESDADRSTDAVHGGPVQSSDLVEFLKLAPGNSETVVQIYTPSRPAQEDCWPEGQEEPDDGCPESGLKPVAVEWEAMLSSVSGVDADGNPASVSDACEGASCTNTIIVRPKAAAVEVEMSTVLSVQTSEPFYAGRKRRGTAGVYNIAHLDLSNRCYAGCVDLEIAVKDGEGAPIDGAEVALSEPNLEGFPSQGTGLLCAENTTPACGSSITLPPTGADGVVTARFWTPGVTVETTGSFTVTASAEGFADGESTETLTVHPARIDCPAGGTDCIGEGQRVVSAYDVQTFTLFHDLMASAKALDFDDLCGRLYGVLTRPPSAQVTAGVMQALRNGVAYSCGDATFLQGSCAQVHDALSALSDLYTLYWFATRFEMPLVGIVDVGTTVTSAPPFLSFGGDFAQAILAMGAAIGQADLQGPLPLSLAVTELSYRASQQSFEDALYVDLTSAANGGPSVQVYVNDGYEPEQWMRWDNNGKRYLAVASRTDTDIIVTGGESASALAKHGAPPVDVPFRPGHILVIAPGTERAEKVQVASVVDSTLALTTPLRFDHVGGTDIILVDSLALDAPDAPVSTTGFAGTPGQPTTPTLTWFARAPAVSYAVEVATDSLFTDFVASYDDVDTTTLEIGPLDERATYYWRVAGTTLLGQGAWSQPFKLVTGAPEGDQLDEALALPFDIPTSHVAWHVATSLEDQEAQPSCGSGDKSLWFALTPSSTRTLAVETFASDFNTVLSVWTGSAHPLTERACNDDWEDAQGRVVAQSYVEFEAAAGTTYYLRVTGADGAEGLTVVQLRAPTQVTNESPEEGLPTHFALHAYPNPFNPQTTIAYALPEAGEVQLAVYDALGRRVRVLVDGPRAAGTHTVTFAADGLPSGVYLVRMTAGGQVQTGRMVLLK